MSGTATNARAILLRTFLRTAEPFYAGAMTTRNRLFDIGIFRSRRLPRPVTSVGNITAGGTGKTPMVRWLADCLRGAGHKVAILSRGYRSSGTELGDELTMLDQSLNGPEDAPVLLRADPDRFASGQSLLQEHPEVDVFLLDDGFQHRRVMRDLDVVLISAPEPFGFGHVLPRGLLREPLSGLRRAGAVVLTHADQVTPEVLAGIESTVRRYNPAVPVYRAIHAQTGLHDSASSAAAPPDYPIEELSRRRFFAFCGIGNPQAFDRQLVRFADSYVGRRWFSDHHHYTPLDLQSLQSEAQAAGAEILVTTEKDWVKIAPLVPAGALPTWRVEMRIQFMDDDETRLLDQIRSVISKK